MTYVINTGHMQFAHQGKACSMLNAGNGFDYSDAAIRNEDDYVGV